MRRFSNRFFDTGLMDSSHTIAYLFHEEVEEIVHWAHEVPGRERVSDISVHRGFSSWIFHNLVLLISTMSHASLNAFWNHSSTSIFPLKKFHTPKNHESLRSAENIAEFPMIVSIEENFSEKAQSLWR